MRIDPKDFSLDSLERDTLIRALVVYQQTVSRSIARVERYAARNPLPAKSEAQLQADRQQVDRAEELCEKLRGQS